MSGHILPWVWRCQRGRDIAAGAGWLMGTTVASEVGNQPSETVSRSVHSMPGCVTVTQDELELAPAVEAKAAWVKLF